MLATQRGTMPAPRKSSITSDEYMEIRRQQNKDAQRRWREKKRMEKEAEEIARSKTKKIQRERSRNASISTTESSPKDVSQRSPPPPPPPPQQQQQQQQINGYYNYSNAPHPAYAPALFIESPHRRPSLPPPFDVMLGRRLLAASQHPTFNLANLTWSEVIALAYQHSTAMQESSSSAFGITLPFSNFAKAFVENAKMIGMDVGYACDPSSSSFISQDWSKYQSDKRFGNIRRRNSNIGSHSNELRKRAESNASSTSSTHSPRNAFNGENNNFTHHLPPPSTLLMEKRLYWENIPTNMHPTEAQLRIDHHPFIDIGFPWPSMREKILTMLASSIIDESDLCDDCFQSGLPGNSTNQEPAFLIWGTDYSDPFTWEVGEKFAQKWWFLLDEDIIHRSNWWRKQRNLPALQRGERKTRLL